MSARVLLLDSDHMHANALAGALEEQGYAVTVSMQSKDIDAPLEEDLRHYDVVVINLTANRPEDWARFKDICHQAATGTPKPLILCVSQRNWGPRMRLDVERCGGRLAYER